MLVHVVIIVLPTQRYSEETYCYPLMLDHLMRVIYGPFNLGSLLGAPINKRYVWKK